MKPSCNSAPQPIPTGEDEIDLFIQKLDLVYTVVFSHKEQTRFVWNYTLSSSEGSKEFSYYTDPATAWPKDSPKNPDRPGDPTCREVLYSLCLGSPACETPFRYWCDDFGTNVDSRDALDLYLKCQDDTIKIWEVIERSKISQLKELYDNIT